MDCEVCPCIQVAEPDSTWCVRCWLLNAARFWWDPRVCFIINWQMSGLIASRAVNFSLHQNDQNCSEVHTASCSVGTVGSAGAWSWLLKSVECRCQDCSTFMVCAGTTLNCLPISIIASQQIPFSVRSKPWNKVLFLKLVFPQLVSKFPAFYVPSWFITMFTRFRQLPLSWARWIYSTPYLPVSLRFSLTLRWLMSYIYGAPILDVSRSHTTTQHSR